uniref:Polysaccharide biosynthesis protein C-terminal domain-containing protein n=1 Tax=Spongospora subterranea TaxID=70186 RepID=A0A0H5RSC0_9EUKA|eukprot:CRZ11639.1 hypothetical protein [Spongospora subterranea]
MFGLIPNTVYYAIRQYFQAQHIVMPALYTNMLFVGVNLFLNVALVHGLGPFPGLGFIGSPIATSLSRTLQLVVFILYTCTWKKLHRTTWPDGSFWDCFSKRHVSEYFKQTIPTMIGNAIEQWQFEAVTLMASRLSVVDLATQSAVFNIFYTFHCITFGLSKAITCRVGYYLGANQPRYARFTSLLAIWLCLGISVCIAAILYLIRNVIGHLYSLDPAIWADSASLMTFLSITYIGVSLLMALISILFGQGRPFPVAVVGGLCAWVVSLPAAYTFSFVFSFGLVGLWMGLSCGYFLSAILLGAIVYRSDWNDCAIQAVSRSTIVYD